MTTAATIEVLQKAAEFGLKLGFEPPDSTSYKDSMTPELNWCGHPIREGEGYGGRPENIPKASCQKPVQAAAKQHYCVVTESHMAEVFGNGSFKLSRPEAAKRLELVTGTHRTTAYRALRLNGRFARHLHSDGAMLSWR